MKRDPRLALSVHQPSFDTAKRRTRRHRREPAVPDPNPEPAVPVRCGVRSSVARRVPGTFRGALQGRADKGLFITTGNFTSQASDEATRDGAIAIDLIDGDRLCDLLKENELGVETEMIENVRIRAEWFGGI